MKNPLNYETITKSEAKGFNSQASGPKVIIAMSGGVDSSIAAALLKKQGFEVVGVFMLFTDLFSFKESEREVKKIAKILEIPVLVLDLRKEFRKKVIGYFIKELKEGRTPNPCVFCNKEIKFRILLKKAREIGAEFIATGHYARLQQKSQSNDCKLLKAKDKEKDQSYFLWQLNQRQLGRILFPIGGYTKNEVRILAKKFGILKFTRPESQEICFVKDNINKFLKKHLGTKPGKIIDIDGKIIGQHQGLIFYTIGQRKTIGLSGGPYYVLEKNLRKNLLIVVKKERDLYKKELTVKNVNWISGRAPKLPLRVKAGIRYRHKAVSAVVTKKSKVIFSQAQRAITPGQSIVFYRGQELLGGGIIR